MRMAKNAFFPNIFEYLSYREYLKDWIRAVPGKKRGQITRIAEHSRIHKTTLSQIFNGTKDLSLEQAHRVAEYLGLSTSELEHFILLVNYARAGTSALRETFRKLIEARRKAHAQLSNRVSKSRELGSEERAVYYSHWIYSAVRNLSAIDLFRKPEAIAKHLGLEPAMLNRVLEFLLKTGLCVQNNGGISPGPQMTHLGNESPLVVRHHGNWRVKAMERHPMLKTESELAYTAPMTLSASDVLKIRDLLADLVEETDKIVGPSPSEKLYCMCLDWFEVK